MRTACHKATLKTIEKTTSAPRAVIPPFSNVKIWKVKVLPVFHGKEKLSKVLKMKMKKVKMKANL